ncbi:hypothetical protein BCR24_13315 [Enterococcus ureilyticus]|uniref:Uncharacterized protein n=1 Tax=Enterococcus ureilyticus TaxID=1131292 RepID=A0A1E5HE95_9ENTE|nr:hypothetical protein [Enterococcus ureilyticus]MBM7689865.1 hypothetical protein [Enterococcus ureilyticus]OEG23125.1 hypothetical protein BCR24_13315 [Enterococcus ureilyticus]
MNEIKINEVELTSISTEDSKSDYPQARGGFVCGGMCTNGMLCGGVCGNGVGGNCGGYCK